MKRTVRTGEPASEELIDAVRWYETRGPGLGGEFFDAVAEMLTLIEARPEIGSPSRRDPQTRRVLVPRFPYQVVYRLTPTEIVIVAVAHLKRRPNYWKSRG
ncbi:MAG: type II toxin-antitoxin system RelE/ParE family toxin [Deltaproteobacteria bacterium]|nr:type II toxin-antitoxin system RelE/ParE family toxin [Deltaproteobacteria bacterium]